MLNPYVKPFQIEYTDGHCLFLTFSNGFPLSERQIFDFFNRMYPLFVKEVYVHRPTAGRPSLFGKVIFHMSRIPRHLMGNHEKVCFCIDGIPLYCRRFVSKKSKSATTASDSLRGGE